MPPAKARTQKNKLRNTRRRIVTQLTFPPVHSVQQVHIVHSPHRFISTPELRTAILKSFVFFRRFFGVTFGNHSNYNSVRSVLSVDLYELCVIPDAPKF